MMPPFKILAFDTSTEVMSIALTDGDRVWQHSGAGGAQASSTLIPAIMALMAQAGFGFDALDAIAFGRGPGSFTGLRTACAVAQGLGLGAEAASGQGDGHGLKAPPQLLPIDTLLAVAEEARHQHGVRRVVALLDARMGEIYAAAYDFDAGAAWFDVAPALFKPEAVLCPPGWALAGNAFKVYGDRLPGAVAGAASTDCPRLEVLPTATALLRLAPALMAAGQAVLADNALPRYVRDKVASTTAERATAKAQSDAERDAEPETPSA